MSFNDLKEKENQNPSYGFSKEEGTDRVTSILKPQNLLSFSPTSPLASKKPGKVSTLRSHNIFVSTAYWKKIKQLFRGTSDLCSGDEDM